MNVFKGAPLFRCPALSGVLLFRGGVEQILLERRGVDLGHQGDIVRALGRKVIQDLAVSQFGFGLHPGGGGADVYKRQGQARRPTS